jgi:hypothetical protein
MDMLPTATPLRLAAMKAPVHARRPIDLPVPHRLVRA